MAVAAAAPPQKRRGIKYSPQIYGLRSAGFGRNIYHHNGDLLARRNCASATFAGSTWKCDLCHMRMHSEETNCSTGIETSRKESADAAAGKEECCNSSNSTSTKKRREELWLRCRWWAAKRAISDRRWRSEQAMFESMSKEEVVDIDDFGERLQPRRFLLRHKSTEATVPSKASIHICEFRVSICSGAN